MNLSFLFLHAQTFVESETLHEHSSLHHVPIHIFVYFFMHFFMDYESCEQGSM
jgi:hypothetical protein